MTAPEFFALSSPTMTAAMAAALEAANAAAALMDECITRKQEGDPAFSMAIDVKSSGVDLVTQYDRQCEEIVLAKLAAFSAPTYRLPKAAADAIAAEAPGAATAAAPLGERLAAPLPARHAAASFIVDGAAAGPAVAGGPAAFEMLSEETRSDVPLSNRPTWVVDPIDGTTSFVHGLFDCGVSVALTVNKVPVLGVVILPRLKETFTAIAGRGAFLNGKPIRASGVTAPGKAVVVTHCAYKRTAECVAGLMHMNTKLLRDYKVHAVRAYGSAAMDMCSVACGRVDMYFECGIQAWDMAAAAVICREAGALVHDLAGGQLNLMARGMVCGSSASLSQIGVELSTETRYRETMFPDLVIPEV